MGNFTREGGFRDRDAFLAALRRKLEHLRDGVLRGGALNWSEAGSATEASLAGFGARVVFRVEPGRWTCAAELPSFLPIPQKMLEAKFDEEFEELKGL
ncbi:MAG TPA: hypothetical protein VGK61_06510 [Planctomycetota bacterium]|jgi:hypothetical protein